MLVEDEPLVACDIEAILLALGHEVVGVAETLAEAMSLAEAELPEAALIDVRLRDGFTGPQVAERLSLGGRIRCAFVTGNPEQVAHIGLPIVAKPFGGSDVDSVLQLLSRR